MKIEVSQYSPSIIRKINKRNSVLFSRWWERYSGIELAGERVLGISFHKSVVLSSKPFEYKYDSLSIWIYILSWPIHIDIRWNKRPAKL